jgi:serine/threonine-protein kinase
MLVVPMNDLEPTEPPSEVAEAAAPGTTVADGAAGRARVRAAPAAAAAAAAAVERIGHFALRGKLGEGGMGVVYEAYDAQLDRQVAIKLVRVDSGGHHARARLLREAQAMAKVSHPNVVPIYEVGEHGDQVFVAMELVPGETLTSWQRREPRAWRDALAMYIAAGRGLAAAHERGIIHRDFKPDNVLVGADGRPRVLDFGLARSVADSAPADDAARAQGAGAGAGAASVLSVDLTIAGSIMGTPSYMSPEHFRGVGVGPASDQFGFAIALYRGLFGSAPFAGDSLGELRAAVCGGALRPPAVTGDMPPALVAAVVRALATEPEARFASMAELLAELERPLRVDPAHDPARGRRARRIAAAILGVGALASLVSSSAMSKIDASPAWLLVQSSIAMVLLTVIGVGFRKRLVTSEHNRRVGLVILVTCGGFVAHRATGVLLDTRALDIFVGDAVLLGVVTVLAGLVFERWMLGGGPLALAYLAFAIALPQQAGPAFGALVFVYAAAAAWRWGGGSA